MVLVDGLERSGNGLGGRLKLVTNGGKPVALSAGIPSGRSVGESWSGEPSDGDRREETAGQGFERLTLDEEVARIQG